MEDRTLLSISTIDLGNQEQDVLVYGGGAGDALTQGGGEATGDINGDGVDDLILSALGFNGPSNDRLHAGEVYIFYGGAGLGGTRDVAGTAGTAPDVVIYGATAEDWLRALTVGDLNGDGIDDLILGSSRADGPGEARTGAGEAYIIFGSTSLASAIDLAVGDEDVLIYGATAGDALGALTVGDLNGDGIDDLILGAAFADGPGEARLGAGEAYVLFGSTSLALAIDLAVGDEDVLIYGATTGDSLTRERTMTVGDLNGDGIDDLILGSSRADGPGEARTGAGEAYIIFGSTSLASAIDLAVGDEDVLIYGATVDDRLTLFGALTVGDLNGDGINDLILGAPLADGPGESRTSAAGEVYVIFGSTSLSGTIDLAVSDEDVLIYGATVGDSLRKLRVGDLNGDGIDDLILGAASASGPGESRWGSGEAYVIFGSTSLSGTIDLADGDEDVLIYGARAGDLLTYRGAITVGDVNGDGIDDLILGAPWADGLGRFKFQNGEAYVIFGSTSLSGTIDLAAGDEDVLIFGATVDDRLTYGALTVGDVNGDGIEDLILGTPWADGPGESRGISGEAYVIFGMNANGAPSITSAAAVDAAENQTSVIDVQSTDPEGETENGGGLTYHLSGGADQSNFSINTNTGVMTLKAAPDFENPGDVGGNNVYDVQVTVTDVGLLRVTGVQDIVVTVTNVDEAPFVVNLIDDVTANEDGPDDVVDLSNVFDDVDAGETLTLTVTGNTNPALLNASILGTDLTLDYLADQSGTADITIRATDDSGLFVQDTFTVTVLSAEVQSGLIAQDVQDLVAADDLSGGQGNSLTMKLDAAVTQDNTTSGVNQLNAFINQVNAFVKNGSLSASDGQALIDAANDLIQSVSSALGAGLVQSASQSSGSSDGAPVAHAAELLTGAIGVFFDDAAATITADQQARFRDSIDTLNVAFGAYGVSLVEVAAATDALIVVEIAASSEGGSAADGLLGYSVAGHITLLSGWNWYAGADPLLIDSNQYDLQTIMTHELGHSAGLAHSGDGGSVMYRMLATSETHRSVAATDLVPLEREAASKPQALLAAPRVDGDVLSQPGSDGLNGTQFLASPPLLFADGDDGTAMTTPAVDLVNFVELSGPRFFTTHRAETDRTNPTLDLPLWTVPFTSDHERRFSLKDLEDDELNGTAKDAGLFFHSSQDAENLGRLFVEFRESIEDELLAV